MILPNYVKTSLDAIIALVGTDCSAVWLFGSRVNGGVTADSDWDVFLFSNERGLQLLQATEELKNPLIDLFVVFDGNHFVEPWPQPGNAKTGSLSDWQWKQLTSNEATYLITKYVEPWFKTGNSVKKELHAIRIWPE